jgi:hypothetical protein
MKDPWKDPIVEEIRKNWEEYASQFDFDLEEIFEDLQRMEREDPIVDEIHRFRKEHAARFDFNLEEMYLDLKRQEAESEGTYVSFSREQAPPTATNPPTAPAHPSKRRGT